MFWGWGVPARTGSCTLTDRVTVSLTHESTPTKQIFTGSTWQSTIHKIPERNQNQIPRHKGPRKNPPSRFHGNQPPQIVDLHSPKASKLSDILSRNIQKCSSSLFGPDWTFFLIFFHRMPGGAALFPTKMLKANRAEGLNGNRNIEIFF